MDPETMYHRLLSRVAATLKYYGYKRRKSNFYVQENGNWGLINFQKSTKSTSEKIIFTVNLGIASTRLLRFFSVKFSEQGPNLWDCHWQRRLGQLIESEDMWWSVELTTIIDELAENILKSLVSLAVSEISKYLDDNELRNLWLSGYSPSLTEFQRLIYLSVFLKELGPEELLDPTLRNLRQISVGKPTSFTADIHIRKLMSY